ncbi:MAG: FecR domain-containing protein [Longimicrobiales bacterium]|nr:FecR domain-containing protein [Longimicrobiales bacterium]
MDDLIIQILSGSSSPFEEERLRRWREAAPENEEHFREMAQVWDLTAPEPVVPVSGPPEVKEILAAAPIPFDAGERSSLGETLRTRRSFWTNRQWVGWGGLAASLAAVGLGIQMVRWAGPEPLAVYEAFQDGSRTVTLGDGSFVRLAEGSTLREWEAEGQREFSLDGRAFFAVARDEARPFVVRAGAGEVRVLGTRFQVATDADAVETVVVEGLVRVSNDEGSVEIPAGSMARMRTGVAPVAEEVDDVFALMSWPEGILVFQATPLSQVADEVSRHYGQTIRIDGSSLSSRRVTAWFQGESFEAVAESLCVVTEAVCQSEGGGLTMGMGGGG